MALRFSLLFFSIIFGAIQSIHAQVNDSKADTAKVQFPEGWSFVFSYPKKAAENNIRGKVVVSFDIDSTCSVRNIRLVSGIGYGCDEEAIRSVKNVKLRYPKKYKCTSQQNILQVFNFVNPDE